MANLTAAEIAAILDAVVYPAEEGVEVNASLMQNEERRKYPSIDVQNITGDEQVKTYPTKTLGQTFLVHLFYRYRSFGVQEEPQIKVLEDLIFEALDNDANFSTDLKVSITQSWDRQSETFPVHRSHSTLTVTSDEISSTDDDGLPGDEMTIEFPAPVSKTFKVINLTNDGRDIIKDLDRIDDGDEIFTKIHLNGLLIAEIQMNFTDETNMESLFEPDDDFSVTLTKSGNPRVLTVNPLSFVSSATREVVQTTLVSLDVKP